MMTPDQQIGRNMAAFRGEMSQKELASQMRTLGWKWSQATVWSIEKGERPLRLAEAEDVTQILGIFTSTRLTVSSDGADILIAMNKMSAANQELEHSIANFHSAQLELALGAESMEISFELGEAVADWLRTTPESLASHYRLENALQGELEQKLYKYDPVDITQSQGKYIDILHANFKAHGEHKETS
ncbi:hypothetical protein [Cryobacterium sp. CG_9.6]|uniref:helix-turn-helix domain-containing protein n=1 Tax=Cryobacterium sp. CG_9.6 TaxID=2760710 RepID=UPI002475F355|nr:hypothetical protein [Cryobacterium sp. CG_9.6]MDH6237041.1 hypothetical protein [Cryobacterium sp. CG_9.6]